MIGYPAGVKTCDDCRKEYAGPAYYTFIGSECSTTITTRGRRAGRWTERVAPHLDCTENLCPDCAGPYLRPDRADDPRRREVVSVESPDITALVNVLAAHFEWSKYVKPTTEDGWHRWWATTFVNTLRSSDDPRLHDSLADFFMREGSK